MGGFNSAPLACLDAMVQEHLAANLMRGHIKLRYRDDILLFPKKISNIEIKRRHDRLNQIYGPDLQVELEQTSHTKINFLEYIITNTLNTYHLNKNSSIEHN